MNTLKKNVLDSTILIIFIIWGINDLFSLIPQYEFTIDLICAIAFVVLFEFALKQTKNKKARYIALVRGIFLFSALLIATYTIIQFHNLQFSISTLKMVNIVLPVQSMVYLYYFSRKNI